MLILHYVPFITNAYKNGIQQYIKVVKLKTASLIIELRIDILIKFSFLLFAAFIVDYFCYISVSFKYVFM